MDGSNKCGTLVQRSASIQDCTISQDHGDMKAAGRYIPFIMAHPYKTLTSFWFLAGLLLLLLNDLVLKQVFHNGLTGKLSDIAGLFIFPIFWTAFFPRQKQFIYIATAFLFLFWKSELSEPFISFWNEFTFLPVQRVVDYSDYLALFILPIAYKYDTYLPGLKTIKLHPILPILFASFAFMATSYRTETNIEKTYHFDFAKDTLKSRFDQLKDLNYGYGVLWANKNPDTLNLTIPSDFCFSNFSAKLAVVKKDKGSVDITLISTVHRCPKSKTDKEKLIREFELKIIDRIKNGS